MTETGNTHRMSNLNAFVVATLFFFACCDGIELFQSKTVRARDHEEVAAELHALEAARAQLEGVRAEARTIPPEQQSTTFRSFSRDAPCILSIRRDTGLDIRNCLIEPSR